MKVSSFESVVQVLNSAKVRYIIVGGMAVNAHGYLRFTRDIDLVIRLSDQNISTAFSELEALGYRPSLPVTALQFTDASMRRVWREEKGMVVLKMWSDLHPETPLDIFVYEPFDFEAEYERAYCPLDLEGGSVHFASIPALIAMKKEAARDQDRIDIEKLEMILQIQEEDEERSS